MKNFIEDTKTLWRYNNSQWQQVTEPPKENLVFAEKNLKSLDRLDGL